MEGAREPAAKPSRKRRVLLALLVAGIVVAAGFVVWWEFVRARTIAEVFAVAHFQPGTSMTVQGTITKIYRENTTYGPKVALQLDNYAGCNASGFTSGQETGQVFGDPNATYSIGQAFQTVLHFQSYTINGDPAVWAPELACPFPSGFGSVRNLVDFVSRSRGILLQYNGSEAGGWQDFRVLTQNGAGLNLSALPVTLETCGRIVGDTPRFPPGSALDSTTSWDVVRAIIYVVAVGGNPGTYNPVVDRMASLRDGTSMNGSLRFIDANADRMLDDGDRLDVRLPPTTSPASWDTYLLQVGSLGTNSTYVASEHLLINGPDGLLEPLLSSQPPMLDLAYVGTQQGPPIQSTVEVSAVRIGPPLPLSAIRYMQVDWTGGSGLTKGNLTSLPATAAGITLSFVDSNGDGLLDAGDRFTVTGATNRTDLSLTLLGPEGGLAYMEWIVGFGPVEGQIPYVAFTIQGSGPWTIRANASSWSPELAFNRTLRVTLSEGGQTVISDVPLANGTLGSFSNGSLSFTDADMDGYLSTGDYFTLSGNPANQYELQLTCFFGVLTFRAYA